MAILNIKNLPDDLDRRLKERAKHSHRSVSQEVIHILAQVLSPQPERSLADLRGLGREIWADVDVHDYIDQERSAWDG
jgi:plasmid stability protein